MLKSVFAGAALGLALAAGLSAPADAQQRTRVTVYTALENDQLAPYKQAIESAVPDVEVVWVRDSTGVITTRLLAERENPRADHPRPRRDQPAALREAEHAGGL